MPLPRSRSVATSLPTAGSRAAATRRRAQLERVRRVAVISELLEIVPTRIVATRPDVARQQSAPPDLDVSVKTRHDVSGDHLHAWVTFTLSSQPSLIDIRATFRLVYRLAGTATAADAKAFAGVNAVYNAWPYWRELVQNSAARMSLAPPTVPLLKI
jgi:hypothetical protein